MNPLIFPILCFFVTEVRSEKALLLNIRDEGYWGNLEDVWHNNTKTRHWGIQKYKVIAACPASSPLEQQFNKDVSLTKQSVFSRLILWRNHSLTDNDVDFCEKSYEPAMIYNSLTGEYKIGYELYFFRNETEFRYSTKDDYYNYKKVNAENHTYNIGNQTIFNGTSEFVIRYEDDNNILFNFTNGYPTLGFYWINVLSINCSKNNKHLIFDQYLGDRENLKDECKNYRLADEEFYSKENQKKCLKDILVPSSSFKGNPDMSCGQAYGCLTPSQILPLWYFDSSSARLASCSHINLIPVWKSIAEGNLRKVDLFVAAIIKNSIRVGDEVIFGVNGVLKMMVPTGWRRMYLSDAKGDRIVEIPKIIYRIIRVEALGCSHFAVIVIHNDPSAVPDADRLCDKNDTLIRTWEKIISDDSKTGLTYVCPMTTFLEKKLDLNCCGMNKLNLAEVPCRQREWSDEWWSYENREEIVNSSFEKFLKEVS
ncbi:uncharacterized protein LOC135844273 isoform X2 [Planococcus citri]|uniref:uncharacterized protein LOC135844273 isoform X2 n=1 Tax=Planococcus citri TaxID=170843 RepID=UPI0031F97CC0